MPVVSPSRISVSRLLDQLTASAFVEKTFDSRIPLMAIWARHPLLSLAMDDISAYVE
jgi:hypothetical protein